MNICTYIYTHIHIHKPHISYTRQARERGVQEACRGEVEVESNIHIYTLTHTHTPILHQAGEVKEACRGEVEVASNVNGPVLMN